jgi:hypothetical protein
MISMTGEGELMPVEKEIQDFADIPDMGGNPVNPNNGEDSALRDSHGTRIAPGTWIDAGGPYGTPDDPLYEGWTQTFSPTMHVDDPNNYDWRWDIGDGWTDWSSSPDYTTTFTDNPKGEAKVQAWDGTQTVVPEFGKPLDETDNIYMYAGNYDEVVFGYRFVPLVDCQVVSLGRLHSTLDDIYECDAVYLWDESNPSTPLATAAPSQAYGWVWTSVTPVDIYAGQAYRVSFSVEMEPWGYIRARNNPRDADGVINVDETVYKFNARDVYPDSPNGGGNTYYVPCVDIEWRVNRYYPEYVEAAAELFVQNVAPIVTVTADPDTGLDGEAVRFLAEMSDPGLDDQWWYRVDLGWGFGDWVMVPNYLFPLGKPNNILIYYDGAAGRDYATQALNHIGLTYTLVSQDANLRNRLTDGTAWDLVIVDNPYYLLSQSTLNDLEDYVIAGGKLIIDTWADSWYPTHSLWETLGAYYGGNYFSPQDIYEWDMTHDIFNYPNDVPTLDPDSEYTGYDGQYLEPIPGVGDAVGGYTIAPSAWNTGLVSISEQTAWNGFLTLNYGADDDGDGVIDMLELYVNEILYLVGPWEEFIPWPDAAALEPVWLTYPDDHPDTWTPSDEFEVTFEFKDDDYVEEQWLTELINEDVEDATIPSLPDKWTQDGVNGWRTHNAYSWPGYGGSGKSFWGYYYPAFYPGGGMSSLMTPEMNAGDSWNLVLDFDWQWRSYSFYSGDMHLYFEGSTDGGNTWPHSLFEIHGPLSWMDFRVGHETIDISSWADGQYSLMIRARLHMEGGYNYMVEFDNFVISGDVHILPVPGLGSDTTSVEIFNVFPTVDAPGLFVNTVMENRPVHFGVEEDWGFRLEDPALKEKTESFWYRILWDDGSEEEWQQTNALMPGEEASNLGHVMVTGVPMDFPLELNLAIDGPQRLFYNWMMFCLPDGEGTILCSDSGYWMWSTTPDIMESNFNNNFGTNYDFIYDNTGTPLVDGQGDPLYDMLYFSYDFLYEFGDVRYTLAEVTEYIEAGGHVFLPGDEFGAGVIHFLPWYVEYPSVAYADFYNEFPGPAFTGDVEDQISLDVQTGDWGFSYELHNDIKGYDEDEWLPVFADPDPTTTIIRPGAGRRFPKDLILPVSHIYGDNGRYDVDIQIIDDDMMWDLTGETPVFTGTGDPMDWVSHNIFPVHVENTDPVVSAIDAYINTDLCLRMSGQKHNTATLELFDNDVSQGSITVLRDPGAPDVECMNMDIHLTGDHNYRLEVIYDPDDLDGANPSWIFETRFPDGSQSELRHTFNSNDPDDRTWTISNGEFRSMFVGKEITLEISADDTGSDDLAVIWNFGDTPLGVHLYSNMYQTMEVGHSDSGPMVFDQLGGDRDPWFDYGLNDERSPLVNPISINDKITHTFDEEYKYFVMVTVVDDDNRDPYWSDEHNPISGSDMAYAEIFFA